MKIGLIDVDSHATKRKWGATIYPNLALCKLAAWHKAQGDEVVWYEPLFTGHCDKVYISKIFNFTPPPRKGFTCRKHLQQYNIPEDL